MAFSFVTCSYCSKNFLKENKRISENQKFGHRFYCSVKCQSFFKNKQVELSCQKPSCKNRVKRKLNDISPNNYCSRSCAVTVNNTKVPKKIATIRKCAYCGNRLFEYRTYCSVKCSSITHSMSAEKIINKIKKFYDDHRRIPLKREFNHYSAARKRFGSWNNAIRMAGFKPNPIMFADKCVAKDGHICDSVAEKIIDDYLYEKGIFHERSVAYPKGSYTADFKIGEQFIEYFGLAGEHKRYDELRKIKQKIARIHRLNLIEIYPQDVYSQGGLQEKIESCLITASRYIFGHSI